MYGGFQWGPQLGPLMPRNASLSDSIKSVGGGFFPFFESITIFRHSFNFSQPDFLIANFHEKKDSHRLEYLFGELSNTTLFIIMPVYLL